MNLPGMKGLDLLVIGSNGARYRDNVWTHSTHLPHPHAPELGLDIGVGLKGHFHRGGVALAGDALGFGPGVQVAGSFDGHGGALGGSDFEGQ